MAKGKKKRKQFREWKYQHHVPIWQSLSLNNSLLLSSLSKKDDGGGTYLLHIKTKVEDCDIIRDPTHMWLHVFLCPLECLTRQGNEGMEECKPTSYALLADDYW